MNTIDAALVSIQNGLAQEKKGQLSEAHELLINGVMGLRKAVKELSLDSSRRLLLIEYDKDAMRHIQRISEVLKGSKKHVADTLLPAPSSTHSYVSSRPQTSEHRSGEDDDYLSFLNTDVGSPVHTSLFAQPPFHQVYKAPAKPTGTTGLSASPPRVHRSGEEPGSPAAQSPTQGTSDIVLKAIDVATALLQRRELKRAVDVLQHAYDVGVRTRIRPGNFERVEEHLVLLRREYYKHFKPRFLQDNPVLPEEMDVLRKSGITATIALPIWDDLKEGYGRENVFMPCEGHWNDTFTPELSSVQKSAGARYVCIGEARRGVEFCIIRAADPLNIKQTVVGDCSMVCSLIICALYQQRFPKAKIISNVIFPQDSDGVPVVNPKGKYCVKMLVNGITRLITVDDRFPANPQTGEMLCTYSRDKSELWVSIMEKAFVKVCGGSYDFPGSSSSSDLYKLSGWLPDSVDFTVKDFDRNLQWSRFFNRYADGSLLITVSTPPLSEAEERRLLLVSEHAYAVLDMREMSGMRLVQLMNPWGRRAWSGKFSLNDKRPEVVKVLTQLQYGSPQADQGIFWITWDDLCTNFSRCSLSWNPYMLFKTPDGMSQRPTRLSCHSRFPYTTSMGQSPQFHIGVIDAPKPSRMHLVFSRHMTDPTAFGQQFDRDHPNVPYVSLKVYDVTRFPSIAQHLGARCSFGMCYCRRLAHGTELGVKIAPLSNPTYRNMAAYTLSFNCPAGTSDLLVVVSRLESAIKSEFSFSLTLHTEWPQVLLQESAQRCWGVYMHAIPRSSLRHCTVTHGKWVKGVSCGGRSFLQTFVYNPQYLLTLARASMVSVRLCVSDQNNDDSDKSVQVHLLQKRQDPGVGQVKWAARVGSTNECSLHLCAPLFAHGGVVVDTSLRSCFAPESVHYPVPQSHQLQSEQQLQQSQWTKKALSTSDGPLPPLPAGDYTIVVAQWEKGIPAAFELTVETTEPHQLREIVPEGVGWVETAVRGKLQGGITGVTRSIMLRTDSYITSNSKVSIVTTSAGVLTARLLLLMAPAEEKEENEASCISTNLTVFRSVDATSLQRVATSGPYRRCGVSLEPLKVDMNATYIIVVSSYTPSREEYVLRIYSNTPLKAEVL
ncbi:calpain-like protein, putative [Trypanosoma brucei gambiense DAL972]|uniref:Calpain-like protein, putative n=2 Tax=Trypanosoma brucei TaxID=5691 RepID=D0A6V9_TRYB9|nr:calpain-like protein, putative [Trypanosoma brucei gambiense DAL972]RHW67290.1 calpain-like protein [Trypanosoma brucei equiperdum]CBH17410.1 calpain-like protein, putative [Trypanosoma brucei gambiense DAL972]|eukprot:XP_011779674.1 calpain-like protein, putative [Trypanosoma brucei gambiense DAL972]